MDWHRRFFTFSRTGPINTPVALGTFVLTEIGRDIYPPRVYSHNINDFGIADTVGNHLGPVSTTSGTSTRSSEG